MTSISTPSSTKAIDDHIRPPPVPQPPPLRTIVVIVVVLFPFLLLPRLPMPQLPPPREREKEREGERERTEERDGHGRFRSLMLSLSLRRWQPMVGALLHLRPRMVSALTSDEPNARMDRGWDALAKLFLFCCGCSLSQNFHVPLPSPGHFVPTSCFSKTSNKSFLTRKCREDLLYVSDPCRHPMKGEDDDDVRVYKGVFWRFMRSRMRAILVEKRVELDARVRCPYCGARVWSMKAARLVQRNASRRLGSHEGCLEYFVCVNGHLHGSPTSPTTTTSTKKGRQRRRFIGMQRFGGVHLSFLLSLSLSLSSALSWWRWLR